MSTISLDIEELRALLSGRFTFFRCIDCDGKGYIDYDGETGTSVAPSSNQEYICRDACESCEGIGGTIQWIDWKE
jgi:hypothetical protein